MAKELFNSIMYNIIMVASFMIPLILCRIADIVFGATLAGKSIDLNFDWNKLWHGIVFSIMIIFGLTCLVAGIVSLPEIMIFYKIELVDIELFDAEILKKLVNSLMVITLLIGTTITYGKDAFEKLKLIFKGKSE